MLQNILDPSRYFLNGYAIPVLATGVAVFCLGVFGLFRERRSNLGVSFLFMCLTVSFYLTFTGIGFMSGDAELSLLWSRIAQVGVVFIPTSFLLLPLALFGITYRYSLQIAASFGLSLLFGLSVFFSDLFVSGTAPFFWGNYAQYGLLGALFLGYFCGIFAFIFFIYLREFRRSITDKHKKRVRWLFIAIGVGSLGSVDFLPCFGISIYPFGYLPIFIGSSLLLYVILRYRLVDITPETAAAEILQTMQGGVIVADLEGSIRVANSIAHEMLGHQPGRLLGMDMTSLVSLPPQLTESVMAGRHISGVEMLWPGRGGQCRVSLSASPLIDSRDCSIFGIVYAAYDITERKRIEDELKRSEASLRNAQKLAHLGNWDWDIMGNTLWWSDEIYRIFGLTRHSFGATYDAFLNSVHPGDRDFVKMSVNKALYEGIPYSIEHRIVLPDGSEKIVHEQAEVVFGADGSPSRMSGTVQDITARKLLEQERERLISELRDALAAEARLKDEMDQLAHHDSLTGLPNRRLFYDRIEQVRLQAERIKTRFALLFIDLDNFKRVNDTYGHDIGDALLQYVADKLQTTVRKSDTVARIAGDEFTIVLNLLNHEDGPGIVASKIIEAFSGPVKLGDITCRIGVSVGIAIYPDNATDIDALIALADAAMYEVKQSGKHGFRYSGARTASGSDEAC